MFVLVMHLLDMAQLHPKSLCYLPSLLSACAISLALPHLRRHIPRLFGFSEEEISSSSECFRFLAGLRQEAPRWRLHHQKSPEISHFHLLQDHNSQVHFL
jgi:hypothetical protein